MLYLDTFRTMHAKDFLLNVKIEDYNVLIDERNFFDQTAKDNMRTHRNFWKIATGQGDDYTSDCFLDYP